MTSPNDLLIIGAGTLGLRVAKVWREKHPSAEIIAETRTDASHPVLKSINVTPNLAGVQTRNFPNVVFCVPPGPFPDYAAAVKAATSRVSPQGRFVFTSSTSVYGNAKFADEHTSTTDEGRGKKIVDAEKAALDSPAGVVIRLSGLYQLDTAGLMKVFARGEVGVREETTWNMIHYDDAADAVVHVILLDELPERIFLATVKNEISAGDYFDCALKHPNFKQMKRPRFLKDGPVAGRKHENSLTRRILDWKPRYESVSEFIEEELRTLNADVTPSLTRS